MFWYWIRLSSLWEWNYDIFFIKLKLSWYLFRAMHGSCTIVAIIILPIFFFFFRKSFFILHSTLFSLSQYQSSVDKNGQTQVRTFCSKCCNIFRVCLIVLSTLGVVGVKFWKSLLLKKKTDFVVQTLHKK